MTATVATEASGRRSGWPRALRGIGVRQVRIACGVVLFSYILSHFTNHALGNISLEAMEYGLRFHTWWWWSWLGTALLYPALLVHGSLGLWALYERRNFAWKAREIVQLVLGLSIPAMLCTHLIGQRVGLELYGLVKGYSEVMFALFVNRPDRGVNQIALLLVAWIHGCIGLYFWLRLRAFFPRVAPYLGALAVLMPVLALLGVYQAGRTVIALSSQPQWRAAHVNAKTFGTPAQRANLENIRDYFFVGYLGVIGLVFAARGARVVRERRRGMVRLTYPDRTVRMPKGMSVLEASRRFKIPHASVCGGRGRCSTCRIRIIGNRSGLPRLNGRESVILERAGAIADPAVRLACQLRPHTDIALVPILPSQVSTSFAYGESRLHLGEERYVVSMFIDMRGSTELADKRLPFDTVFIINRFIAAASQAVIEAGGQPNQYLGDGLLALFGLASDPGTACRQALNAAAMVAGNVDHLNKMFGEALRQPLQFGIGIHGGEVILGDVGYREHVVFTAMGDAVNVAARLQDMSKSLACEVVLSEEVRANAAIGIDALPSSEVAIRGRAEPMHVRTVTRAETLAELLEAAPHAVA